MEIFLAMWSFVKRYLVSLKPVLFGLVFGAVLAIFDSIGAYIDSGKPLTWHSLFIIISGALLGYTVKKAHSATTLEWIKALLETAFEVLTPKEALEKAAEQVKPFTSLHKLEAKVLPEGEPEAGKSKVV